MGSFLDLVNFMVVVCEDNKRVDCLKGVLTSVGFFGSERFSAGRLSSYSQGEDLATVYKPHRDIQLAGIMYVGRSSSRLFFGDCYLSVHK